MNLNLAKFSAEEWQQAHWFSRFSENPESQLVIKACSDARKSQLHDDFISTLGITKQPVFSGNNLVGMWCNIGNAKRPSGVRFCERWNDEKLQFDMWIYKPQEGALK